MQRINSQSEYKDLASIGHNISYIKQRVLELLPFLYDNLILLNAWLK